MVDFWLERLLNDSRVERVTVCRYCQGTLLNKLRQLSVNSGQATADLPTPHSLKKPVLTNICLSGIIFVRI